MLDIVGARNYFGMSRNSPRVRRFAYETLVKKIRMGEGRLAKLVHLWVRCVLVKRGVLLEVVPQKKEQK